MDFGTAAADLFMRAEKALAESRKAVKCYRELQRELFPMNFERTYFAPGQEPEVFTTNVCEKFHGGQHELCPGWMKFDLARMESPTATEKDTVFCICACHKQPQA
jgi:hypothetical protein